MAQSAEQRTDVATDEVEHMILDAAVESAVTST